MDIQGYPWLSIEYLGSVWCQFAITLCLGLFGVTLGLVLDQFGATLG
jgi:hypothetical protein